MKIFLYIIFFLSLSQYALAQRKSIKFIQTNQIEFPNLINTENSSQARLKEFHKWMTNNESEYIRQLESPSEILEITTVDVENLDIEQKELWDSLLKMISPILQFQRFQFYSKNQDYNVVHYKKVVLEYTYVIGLKDMELIRAFFKNKN